MNDTMMTDMSGRGSGRYVAVAIKHAICASVIVISYAMVQSEAVIYIRRVFEPLPARAGTRHVP